jgi:hypothetical protein
MQQRLYSHVTPAMQQRVTAALQRRWESLQPSPLEQGRPAEVA